MYVELKTGYNDNGPAWIGRVTFSKTGQTIYSRGKSLSKIPGGGISANYRDVDTGGGCPVACGTSVAVPLLFRWCDRRRWV